MTNEYLEQTFHFEKVIQHFRGQVPLLSPQACLCISCTTVAISVHTAAPFWQDCCLPDTRCPAATERFMTLIRPFTFNVSFVILCVCVCACAHLCTLSIIAMPCILLAAVLNCLTASGLQGLTGHLFCRLIQHYSDHTTILRCLKNTTASLSRPSLYRCNVIE